MLSVNSSSDRRHGQKVSHSPRAAIPSNLTRSTSSSSNSSESSSSQVQFGNRHRLSNFASDSSLQSSRTDVTRSSFNSIGSAISLASDECNVVAPELTIDHGDRKQTYHLADKGKMVVINRKNGDVVYMLRCVDGRRVYIEKSVEGASLILTNQRGKVTKALAGQY